VVGGFLHWPHLDPANPAPLSPSPEPFDPSNPVGDPSKVHEVTLHYTSFFGDSITGSPVAHVLLWAVAFAVAGAVIALCYVAYKQAREGDEAAKAAKEALGIPE